MMSEKALDTATISSLVSAGAVVVSAVAIAVSARLQEKSIRIGRDNALAALNAAHRKDWITNFQKLLAKYLHLIYLLDSRFRTAQLRSLEWPGENGALVNEEDRTYNEILLRLDVRRAHHSEFESALKRLREQKFPHPADWFDQRDVVVSAARAMFTAEWSGIVNPT